MERVMIFDTTLRDGEQSPGAKLGTEEKLKIARQLVKLNVDVIEAGFPISSPGDFEAVKRISREVRGPVICGLTRAVRKDIDVCWDAIKSAEKPRIHTGIGTSDIHIKYKFKKTHSEILKIAVEAVKHAKACCDDVEFFAEDAGRSDPRFLCEVLEAVVEAGATVLNIPDTTGYMAPDEFGDLVKDIKENVRNVDETTISVHCHNDLGMATANSLAGVRNGARQIECTINGIGERAGNTSLEEVVMALKTRLATFDITTNIKTKEIYKTSRLVSTLTGFAIPPNKAIVGANAFAHSSGIHQDGVLKERTTYEIMKPEDVGIDTSSIILTARSGRHALKHRIKELGYVLKEEEIDRIYERFLKLADKKKEIFDEDLEVIVEDEISAVPEVYSLDYFHYSSGTDEAPHVIVRLRKVEETLEETSTGDGPVDAAYRAVDKLTGIDVKLLDYLLRAVTRGKEALGEVSVKVESKQISVVGRGASTDIVEASIKAYLNAVNKLVHRVSRKGEE